MEQKPHVTFAISDQLYLIEKDNYNRVEGRRLMEKCNRQLRSIEKYMKANHLLFKNEFLEFTFIPYSHLRIQYIEFICKQLEWISDTTHLKIVS